MRLQPTVSEQSLLAKTLHREATVHSRRERSADALVNLAFLAAAATLLVVRPPHGFSLLEPAICVVVLALATRVRFYLPSGWTVPTQLPFVPLVFTLPLSVVPFAVVLAFMLARLPDVLAGRAAPGRVLHSIGNSFFALGPVAVFAIAGVEPSHASPLLLLAALLAQFVADFAGSSVWEWIADGLHLRTQLNDLWVYGVDAALSPIALVVAHQVQHRPLTAASVLPLLGVFAVFARERRARLESLVELKNAYHGTALVLGDVVEADDGYTGQHCKSVVTLALQVGEHIGLGPERLRDLEFGALLHDVGKIAIPKEIINKPAQLDPAEWAIIKTHTVEGQRMLEQVGGFMREVGNIVRSHHERWDGTGYPDGLAGEDIPLESRIIACCDAYNAMRTDRPYRKALPQEDAIAELLTCAGGQFDPGIVRALLEVVDPAAAKRMTEPAPAVQDDGLDLLALDPSRVLDSSPTRAPRA